MALRRQATPQPTQTAASELQTPPLWPCRTRPVHEVPCGISPSPQCARAGQSRQRSATPSQHAGGTRPRRRLPERHALPFCECSLLRRIRADEQNEVLTNASDAKCSPLNGQRLQFTLNLIISYLHGLKCTPATCPATTSTGTSAGDMHTLLINTVAPFPLGYKTTRSAIACLSGPPRERARPKAEKTSRNTWRYQAHLDNPKDNAQPPARAKRQERRGQVAQEKQRQVARRGRAVHGTRVRGELKNNPSEVAPIPQLSVNWQRTPQGTSKRLWS